MDDTTITVADNPVATAFETVNTYTAPDFIKHRLKAADTTLDVALVAMDEEAVQDYVQERRETLQTMNIDVPKPYRSEIETRKQDEERRLTFHEEDDTWYGEGYADPEYNLILADMDQIIRYRYLVTWRYFPDHGILAEIEVYAPKDGGLEGLKALSRSIGLA